MKKLVVSFICILIVLGAVSAVFAGDNFRRHLPDVAEGSEMTGSAEEMAETEYGLLGVYIA